nr:hypothetical transcript [Hymenolepis microstoma]
MLIAEESEHPDCSGLNGWISNYLTSTFAPLTSASITDPPNSQSISITPIYKGFPLFGLSKANPQYHLNWRSKSYL